jgi:hypothetical protein
VRHRHRADAAAPRVRRRQHRDRQFVVHRGRYVDG